MVQYPVRLVFRKRLILNNPKNRFSTTIYVSNHPAAFMDPIILSILNKPVVHFLVRSDVFTKLTNPFFKNLHMLPIYRQHDGVNTKEKNKKIFSACSNILIKNKNILIFGEGFSDDVFIRRLKPLKKGAVRIGFTALEKCNWEKQVYIAAIGCNYANPNVYDSELIISNSKPICLNDFKEMYLEKPIETINKLNKSVTNLLKKHITHLENEKDSSLHENIMRITGEGINSKYYNKKIALKNRFKMSQKTAFKLNDADDKLKSKLNLTLINYFQSVDKNKINDLFINEKHSKKKYISLKLLWVFALLPIATLGLFHAYLPYLPLKKWVEQKFKRPAFWPSVKIILGSLLIALINIPIILLLNYYFIENGFISFIYYLFIGVFGFVFMFVKTQIKLALDRIRINPLETKSFFNQRLNILIELKKNNFID